MKGALKTRARRANRIGWALGYKINHEGPHLLSKLHLSRALDPCVGCPSGKTANFSSFSGKGKWVSNRK
jgi:hypothetical protein